VSGVELGVALAHPWLLARVAASALAMALLLGSLAAALRGGARRVELSAALLAAALRVELAAVALSALSAARLVDAVPGARCAYGVLHASDWGVAASWASLLAALACAAGSAVSDIDGWQRFGGERVAVRVLLAAAVTATAADLVCAAGFATSLDLDTRVSCCLHRVTATPASAPAAAASAFLLAAAVIAAGAQRPRAAIAASSLALTPMTQATRDLVTPATLGLPQHRCLACAAASAPFGAACAVALVAVALLVARGSVALAYARFGRGEAPAAAQAMSRAAARGLSAVCGLWLVSVIGALLSQRAR
jgi:hypothetical protein